MAPRSDNARNEAFFRAVNEGIAEASERFESKEAEFLCECGDANCTHRIEVPLDEYEHVRTNREGAAGGKGAGGGGCGCN